MVRAVARRRPWQYQAAAIAGRAAGTLARYGFNRIVKGAGRRVKRPRSTAASTSMPISQYDNNRLVYRRKKMPYRKRKRWGRFKRKVQSVAWGATKKQVMFHKDSFDLNFSNDGVAVGDVMLYSGFNTSFPPCFDLQRICEVATVNFSTESVQNKANLMIKSALLNITVSNPNDKSVYLDLYWFYSHKNNDFTPREQVDAGLSGTYDNETYPAGNPPTNKTLSSFGTTPFMSSMFCKNNKIYKVTKHLIAPGQSIEFTMKDKKDRMLKKPSDLLQENSCTVKGFTKGCVMIAYGIPSAVAGNSGQYGASGTLFVRREVTYKFHEIDVGSKDYVVDY